MKWAPSAVAALAFAGPSSAGSTVGPAISKRQGVSDADVLNFALTLEHLEDKFYREGLANYTREDFRHAGFDRAFYSNLQEISFDETTHVNFLTSALAAAGAPAVAECTYRFNTTTVQEFLGVAAVLEGVGVAAYIGAAALISTKAYLTAAASILSIEAKHLAYLRASLGRRPFPQPFDAPLSPNKVYTLAKQFIISCPSTNPTFLPLAAFPLLAVTSHGDIKQGDSITLTVMPKTKNTRRSFYKSKPEEPCCGAVFAAFAALGGSVIVPAAPVGNSQTAYKVKVPAGIHGQTYVVLTNSATDDSDSQVIAGPAIIEVVGASGDTN